MTQKQLNAKKILLEQKIKSLDNKLFHEILMDLTRENFNGLLSNFLCKGRIQTLKNHYLKELILIQRQIKRPKVKQIDLEDAIAEAKSSIRKSQT